MMYYQLPQLKKESRKCKKKKKSSFWNCHLGLMLNVKTPHH